jgi:RHS repeat-associated protein
VPLAYRTGLPRSGWLTGSAVSVVVSTAVLMSGVAVAVPTPARAQETPKVEREAMPAAPTEGYTPNSHWVLNQDGKVTRAIFPGIAFHTDSDGAWQPIRSDVRPVLQGTAVVGATAAHAVRPVRFGDSAKDLLSLPLDGGAVTLSAPDLHIAAPLVAADGVSYADVAPSTKLTFDVRPDGVKQSLVLASAQAPRLFRFHLADPAGVLGAGTVTADGGFAFDRPVADGLRLMLSPAVAFEQASGQAEQPVPGDPRSALMTVKPAGDGYDIVETINPAWLVGKSYPLVLDPSLTYVGAPSATDCAVSGVPTAVNTVDCTSTSAVVGANTLGARRMLLRFDTSDFPSPSQVTSAGLTVTSTAGSGAAVPLELREVGAAWSSSPTWLVSNGSTAWPSGAVGGAPGSTQLGTASLAPGSHTTTFTSAAFTALVQSWINGSTANNGMVLKATSESAPGPGLVSISSAEAGTQSIEPSLLITYNSPPDAPGSVVATRADRAATVTWTTPADNGAPISGYTLTAYQGSTVAGTGTAAAGATSGSVGGLSNGTTYTIGVTASNGIGTGPTGMSNTVMPASVPLAPASISATAGDTTATVTWAAANANGDPLTGYRLVTYLPDNSVLSTTSLPIQTSTTVTGLSNGTAYTFTVAGVNGLGTGAASSRTSAVTPAGLPFAPTNVAVAFGNASASLSWTPSGDNGAAISNYAIKTYAGTTLISTTLTGSNNPSGTVTGLTNGTSYTFTVSAINSIGAGSPSAPTTPGVPGLPGTPAGVSAVRGDTSATVSWTTPSANGNAITSYTVRGYIGSTLSSTSTASGTATSLLVTGLTNGSAYSFTVTATNIIGDSPASTPSTAVTPAGVPLVPTGVSASAGDHSAQVSWTAPSGNGDPITGYTVKAYAGATLVQTVTLTSPVSSTTVTGLTNGTAYTFTVAATNTVGTGVASSATSAVTPAGLPAAPSPLGGTRGDGSVALSWPAVSPNGSALTGYTVKTFQGVTLLSTTPVGPAVTSLTVSGLTNGTAYTFTVTATNGVGTGPAATSAAVTPAGLPGTPTGVGAGVGDRSALVSWTPPSGNGDALTTFVVLTYSGGNVISSTTVGGANTTGQVTGLTPGSTYTFTVTASNTVGTGAPSSATAPLTAVGSPDAPVTVSAVAGDTTATATWATATPNNTPVLAYQLVVHRNDGSSMTPVNADAAATQATLTGLTDGQPYTIGVQAISAVGPGPATVSNSVTPVAPGTSAGGGEYVPVTPTRIIDTRTGLGGTKQQLGTATTFNFTVVGTGDVPGSGVAAVVLSLTTVSPSVNSWMTVWPTGAPRPGVSQITTAATVNQGTTVVSAVGVDGQVSIYNNAGTLDVLVDVLGYYTDNTATTAGGTFAAVTPSRVTDTRNGLNSPVAKMATGETRAFTMTGVGGVPAGGVAAVVFSLAVTNATNGTSWMVAYRHGDTLPETSNINVIAGQTTNTLITVPVSASGQVDVYNNGTPADVIMDMEGYYLSAASTGAQRFVPINPDRIYNSLSGLGYGGTIAPLTGGSTRTVVLAGAVNAAGNTVIPSTGVTAVVLSLQAYRPQNFGYFTGYPTGTIRPGTAALNYFNAQNTSYTSAFIAQLGNGGSTNIYASAGNVDLVVEVEGYYVSTPPAPPAAPTISSSAYPSGISSWVPTTTSGTLTLTDTSSGVDHYLCSYNDPAMTVTFSARPSTGSTATTTITPGSGWQALYCRAVGIGNNLSPVTSYSFGNGPGLTQPDGAVHTQRDLPLAARGQAGYDGITFNYRRASTGSFAPIPVADVTNAGAAVTAWPVSIPAGSDSTSPTLTWNAARTLGLDGPVTIQACLRKSADHSVTDCATSTVDAVLDRGGDTHPTATTSFGPGELNLLTGNLNVGGTDATLTGFNSDLNVARSFDTRSPLRAVPGAAELLTDYQSTLEPTPSGVGAGNATLTQVGPPSPVFSLAHALKITPAASGLNADTFANFGDAGALRNQMRAGHSYTLTTHIYVPAATGLSGTGWSNRALRAVVFYGTSGVYTEVSTSTPTLTDGWQTLSVRFTIPTTSNEAFIRLYDGTPTGDVPGSTSKVVYYDDSSLTEEGIFGPGWVPSLPVTTANATWAGLTDAGSVITLHDGDGTDVTFTKGASSNSYEPTGDDATRGLTLAPSTIVNGAATTWALHDLDGNTTVFAQPTGVAAYGSAASATSPHAYQPSTVTQPGSSTATTFTYDGQGRVTEMLAPVPAGGSCSTWGPGCRAVDFSYNGSGHVTQLSFKTTDNGGGQLSVVIGCFQYDEGVGSGNTGRLTTAWDPRLSSSSPSCTVPAGQNPPLASTYGYDSIGRLNKITPPGMAAWNLTFDSAGRVSTAGRTHNSTYGSGTEAGTVQYDLPTGTDATHPYWRPDLGSTAVVAPWGQSDVPSAAVAIFGPGDTVSSTDLRAGRVTYMNSAGRITNTASFAGTSLTDPTGWHFDSTSYDSYGNVVRSLDATNRELALQPANAPAGLNLPSDTVAAANALAEIDQYSSDGMDLIDSFGPYHLVTLADGTANVGVRAHSHTSYDTGAELGHPAGPTLHVPVSTYSAASRSALAVAANETDRQATTTAYALSANDTTGWTFSAPMQVTTDPAGLALSTVARYDANTGLPVESRMPSNPIGGGAGSTLTTYYTAGATNNGNCVNTAWVNLACKTTKADTQPTTGLPGLVVSQVTSYDYLNRPLTVVESVVDAGGVTRTRTTTTVFESGGLSPRVASVTLTGGLGTAVPVATFGYDTATSLPTTVTRGSMVTTGYDDFGRVVSYNDGSGAAATTTTYDAAGRPATITDVRGSQTFGYNAGGERRGLPTSLAVSGVGSFAATYDANGALASQTWPNSATQTWTRDQAGQVTRLQTVRASTMWLDETVQPDVQGRWRTRQSSIGAVSGAQGGAWTYQYDQAGRLSQVTDSPTGGSCATRTYGFDADSNRLTATSYPAGTGGSCQSNTGASTVSRHYDSADRLLATGIDTGLGYDAFGRITTLPGTDTSTPAAGAVSTSFYANDLVRSISQGTSSATFTLDPADRLSTLADQDAHTATNHYDGSSDSPSWIAESDGVSWTRNISGLDGALVGSANQGGAITYQLANLHGDVVATASSADTQPTVGYATDEFGNPQGSAPSRYGWLGAKQRAADIPGGLTLMGVRLYAPVVGRFLSVDPVPGGNANAYTYPNDPINQFDLDGRSQASKDPGKSTCDSKCMRNLNAKLARIAFAEKWGRILSKVSHFLSYMWFCAWCKAAAFVLNIASTVLLAYSGQGNAAVGQLLGYAVSAAAQQMLGGAKVIQKIMNHRNTIAGIFEKFGVSGAYQMLGYISATPLCGKTPWCGK